MATEIITRAENGEELTFDQVDRNFIAIRDRADASLRKDQNLSDVNDVNLARDNLGLGTAAIENAEAFATAAQGEAADTAVQPSRKVEGGDGLAGGGDLSQDRSITLSGQTKYDLDQLYAQLRRAEYGDGPYPVFDQVFGAGASILDPRITHTRPGKSWRIVNGVLREYDVNEPVLTGAGLDLRPAETNLVGADIAGSDWAIAGSRLTMGPVVEQAGFSLRKATIAVESVSGSYVAWSPQIPVTPGKVTLTAYLKQDTPGWAFLSFRDDATSKQGYAYYDLATGTVGHKNQSSGWSVIATTMEALSDGVWRLDLVVQTDGTQVRPSVYGQCAGNVNQGSVGLSGNVWYAAVQVNQGDPIPYIPTTSGAVTRPADDVDILGSDFAGIWNPTDWAVILDVGQLVSTPRDYLFSFSDGTVSNFAGVRIKGSGTLMDLNNTGTGGGGDIGAPASLHYGGKIGLTQSGGRIRCHVNGTKKLDIAATVPAAISRFSLGKVASQNRLPITPRRLAIFNQGLSDAQMEALTS